MHGAVFGGSLFFRLHWKLQCANGHFLTFIHSWNYIFLQGWVPDFDCILSQHPWSNVYVLYPLSLQFIYLYMFSSLLGICCLTTAASLALHLVAVCWLLRIYCRLVVNVKFLIFSGAVFVTVKFRCCIQLRSNSGLLWGFCTVLLWEILDSVPRYAGKVEKLPYLVDCHLLWIFSLDVKDNEVLYLHFYSACLCHFYNCQGCR